MSSACTIPRLVRCRVKDLASCFYACRLPLEEEPDISHGKRPQTTSKKGSITDESRGRHKKSSGDQTASINVGKKNRREEDGVIRGGESSASSQNNVVVKAEDGSMAKPRFAEEDYIVFCFRDDGEIHMINEAAAKSSSRAYDDDDNDDDDDDDGEKDYHQHANTTTAAANTLRNIMTRKGEWPPDDEDEDEDEVREKKSSGEEEHQNGSKMESFESCDSNLSDTSTTSFAFPVLGIEWIGSPVHMPKSEKHDASPSVRLHCCRF